MIASAVVRIEIASALQRMVSALRLASVSLAPIPRYPKQKRRNIPRRRFQISLRNGPTYRDAFLPLLIVGMR
jgi:hypothetical protein